MKRELSVVGGGVVGLTCALAAADRGWSVTVFDAGPKIRASQVAGGMLGCFGEGHPGERELLEISSASVALWPALLARLGDPAVSTARDSLLVGASSADLEHLDEQVRFVAAGSASTQSRIKARTGAMLRSDESALVRGVAGGYRVTGEGAVDNRRLLTALADAAAVAGVRTVPGRVDDPAEVPGERVLVAAGLDSGRLSSLCGARVELVGEKGEIVRLRRTKWSVPPPEHVIRARWHGRSVYLVPRADGVVVGATQYEAVDVDDRAPQLGGVADLLADAGELMPGLRTYEVTEVSAGIRPSSTDGLPVVRRIDERLVVAAGHGRNGIALAPWTAAAVLELLDGDSQDGDRHDGGSHDGVEVLSGEGVS